MKYTIEGFSQEQAVQLGLTAEDLVILRWFVDFWPSEKMVKMQSDGKTYALVCYAAFIEQMPIIGCNKRTIARKFQRLVDAKVLENVTIKQGGSFSVYRFGENYERLLHKNVKGCTEIDNPVVQESTTRLYKNVHTNTNLSNTNLLNTKERERAKAPPSRFTPPTVEEVAAYCRERQNSIDAQHFVDYYASNGWMRGKTHIKDWKAAVRTWEQLERPAKPTGDVGKYYAERHQDDLI